jgi:outer membrane protein assembly factor BamE (lipoprotein component of BamABCDE complex)
MYKKFIQALVALTLISGWSLQIDSYNGHTNIEHHNVDEEDTKKTVLEKLGGPTSRSYNPTQDTWYYIYTHAKHISFLYPKYIYIKTLAISFNADEAVQDIKIIENYDKCLKYSAIPIAKNSDFSLKKLLSSLQFTGNKNIK